MRWWVIAVLAGCYSPTFQSNVPCTASLTCPDDQTCDTSRSPPVCVTQGGSADGGMPDGPSANACGTCPSDAPVCDHESTTCRGCYADDECSSHVCSESTGLCVPAANTLFVRTTGDDANPCTHDQPCLTVSRAVTLVDDTHQMIRIYDGTYTDAFRTSASFTLSGEHSSSSAALIIDSSASHVAELDGGTVTFEGIRIGGGTDSAIRVAGGATLTLDGVEVGHAATSAIESTGSTVNLYGVELHDGGGTSPGVSVQSGALNMFGGSVYAMGGPCVFVQGARYDIENTFLVGCAIGFRQSGQVFNGDATFDFNTVASNGTAGLASTSSIAVKDSIFAYNGSGNELQIPLTVSATYCLVSAGLPPPGTGNITGDPQFVANDDLHIQLDSPARDRADPASTLKLDWDGDARPHGAGYDIGADEHY